MNFVEWIWCVLSEMMFKILLPMEGSLKKNLTVVWQYGG